MRWQGKIIKRNEEGGGGGQQAKTAPFSLISVTISSSSINAARDRAERANIDPGEQLVEGISPTTSLVQSYQWVCWAYEAANGPPRP
jgi:hypothetical protein